MEGSHECTGPEVTRETPECCHEHECHCDVQQHINQVMRTWLESKDLTIELVHPPGHRMPLAGAMDAKRPGEVFFR